ncbi:MAG: hypothetical protein PUB63_00890 [Clostridia bacterium]|nr:hypothetical protein [Clostridia bacterium]
MALLFILFCIAYIAGLGFWLMDRVDRFLASGGIRPSEEDCPASRR